MNITLRDFDNADGIIFANWVENKEIMRKWGVTYKDRDDAIDYPGRIVRKGLVFICKGIWVQENDQNTLVGMITLSTPEKLHNRYITGLGYIIDQKYWNKGIATEAVRQVLVYANNYIIIAWSSDDNIASQKVLTKCGFKYMLTNTDSNGTWLKYQLL